MFLLQYFIILTNYFIMSKVNTFWRDDKVTNFNYVDLKLDFDFMWS